MRRKLDFSQHRLYLQSLQCCNECRAQPGFGITHESMTPESGQIRTLSRLNMNLHISKTKTEDNSGKPWPGYAR
jgi:hypothetical protein